MPKLLYDPKKTDEFGIELEDYKGFADSFSEDFLDDLNHKAANMAESLVFMYGKQIEDPRAIAYAVGSVARSAIAFAVLAGYAELTETGKRDLSAPVASPADETISVGTDDDFGVYL